MSIQPGTYTAKIVDYGVKLTEKGQPNVTVKFSFNETNTLIWSGGFYNERATEITLKALGVCGLATTDIAQLADGPASGMLDTDKEVEIAIDHEEYNGRTYAKIKWINEVGGGGIKNRLTKGEAAQAFVGLNLQADIARLGIIKERKPAAPAADSTDIPF